MPAVPEPVVCRLPGARGCIDTSTAEARRTPSGKAANGSSAGFPTCCVAVLPACERCRFCHRPVISTSCRLEIGDTAGWETCATARSGPHLTHLTHSHSFLSFAPLPVAVWHLVPGLFS